MTGRVRVVRPAPRLDRGGRFGATLSAGDRRLIEARFTITGPSDSNGFVNALPMLHSRYFPSIESGAPPSMDELVTMKSYDWDGTPIWQGQAELALHDSPSEELARIAPKEMIGAYYRSVAASWREGTMLDAGHAGGAGSP